MTESEPSQLQMSSGATAGVVAFFSAVLAFFWALSNPSPSKGKVEGITFDAIKGDQKIDLESFRGRPVLVVNTASKCGFTPQYAALEKLYNKYKDSGLVIIGVPSDNFNQEPKDSDQIAEFCSARFKVTFIMVKKVNIREHPFYEFVTSQKGLGFMAKPRWNFWKILIGKDGNIVNYFTPFANPLSSRVTAAIEKELPSKL